MSNLFSDVMTVYNYHKNDDETEIWTRTVVKGVQWNHNRKDITTTNGVQAETKVESITVDFQRDYGNKPYIDPITYSKLSVEELSNYWTLNAKCGQDKLVFGESDKEISGRKYKLSELDNDFQYVGTVQSVSDNRNRNYLRTIKVVAK